LRDGYVSQVIMILRQHHLTGSAFSGRGPYFGFATRFGKSSTHKREIMRN